MPRAAAARQRHPACAPLCCDRLGDYGIPYGYSPVLLAHPDAIRWEERVVREEAAQESTGVYAAAGDQPTHRFPLL